MSNPIFFDAVVSRLRETCDLGGTDIAIADYLGIGRSAYSARKKNGSIPYAEIVERALTQRIDLNYVLAGQRLAAREDAAEYVAAPDERPIRLVQVVGRRTPGSTVPIVEDASGKPCIEVPAGWLKRDEPCIEDEAPSVPKRPDRYLANEVQTDSMISSGIARRDIVLARQETEIPQGSTCLISVLSTGFWVRRWWRTEDGGVLLRPHSPDPLERETRFGPEDADGVIPLGLVTHVIKRVEV